jgi:hypothetical protein
MRGTLPIKRGGVVSVDEQSNELACYSVTRARDPRQCEGHPDKPGRPPWQLHSLLMHQLQRLSAAASDSEDLACAGTAVSNSSPEGPSTARKRLCRVRSIMERALYRGTGRTSEYCDQRPFRRAAAQASQGGLPAIPFAVPLESSFVGTRECARHGTSHCWVSNRVCSWHAIQQRCFFWISYDNQYNAESTHSQRLQL